jgi:hypothetical protein
MTGCAPDLVAAPIARNAAPRAIMPETPQRRVAASFVEQLAEEKFGDAVELFDAQMAKALADGDLRALWARIIASQGPWVGVDGYSSVTEGPVETVAVDARFARRRQRFLVSIDASGKVAWFHRGPVPEDADLVAISLVKALAAGDAKAATSAFDERMRAALPPDVALTDWLAVLRRSTSPARHCRPPLSADSRDQGGRRLNGPQTTGRAYRPASTRSLTPTSCSGDRCPGETPATAGFAQRPALEPWNDDCVGSLSWGSFASSLGRHCTRPLSRGQPGH